MWLGSRIAENANFRVKRRNALGESFLSTHDQQPLGALDVRLEQQHPLWLEFFRPIIQRHRLHLNFGEMLLNLPDGDCVTLSNNELVCSPTFK